MKILVELLPTIHIVSTLMLLLFVLYRGYFLYKDARNIYSKTMMNAFSALVLVVFFSGVAWAFALGIPFSHPFILFKLVGFLVFTALCLVSFAPTTKPKSARLLLALALLLYLLLASLLRLLTAVPL